MAITDVTSYSRRRPGSAAEPTLFCEKPRRKCPSLINDLRHRQSHRRRAGSGSSCVCEEGCWTARTADGGKPRAPCRCSRADPNDGCVQLQLLLRHRLLDALTSARPLSTEAQARPPGVPRRYRRLRGRLGTLHVRTVPKVSARQPAFVRRSFTGPSRKLLTVITIERQLAADTHRTTTLQNLFRREAGCSTESPIAQHEELVAIRRRSHLFQRHQALRLRLSGRQALPGLLADR